MKVLLIRLSALGDVILATSVFDPLKSVGADIDFVTDSSFSELFEDDPRIRRLFTVKKEALSLKKLREFSREFDERYDAVIDLHAIPKTVLLSKFLKSDRVLRLKKKSVLRRLCTKVRFLKGFLKYDVISAYAETVRRLKVAMPTRLKPHIYLQDGLKARFSSFSGYVGIAAGARYVGKRYPADRFKRLVSLLKERGFKTVGIGSSSEFELHESIAVDVNMSGRLSLKESCALISNLSLLISNDSSPVHMARAVGTKVISLFGPTHPCFGFAPSETEGSFITLDLNCSPCSLHGEKTCRERKCFDIAPERVFNEALKFL